MARQKQRIGRNSKSSFLHTQKAVLLEIQLLDNY